MLMILMSSFMINMMKVLSNNKMMSMIISMEMMMVTVYMFIMQTSQCFMSVNFSLLFLSMAVCESVLGLSLIVKMNYSKNNKFKSMINF